MDPMDEKERDNFISLWSKYFGDAQLPMAVFFSNEPVEKPTTGHERSLCIVSLLPHVREGRSLCFSAESKICGGARRYLGFATDAPITNFEYFLSYGIPGKLKGERYKKSPELVRESVKSSPPLKAPKPFIVFKRWDKLSATDEPEIAVFLASIDTIAGLFTLANYDEAEPNAVISPFGSGCSSIVYHPYMELKSPRPRCVLGMFDISARPYVGENTLSFAAPYPKFRRMVDNMEESFLTTDSWSVLRTRDK
jgi:uncharacterized protein (DUF169 family)